MCRLEGVVEKDIDSYNIHKNTGKYTPTEYTQKHTTIISLNKLFPARSWQYRCGDKVYIVDHMIPITELGI